MQTLTKHPAHGEVYPLALPNAPNVTATSAGLPMEKAAKNYVEAMAENWIKANGDPTALLIAMKEFSDSVKKVATQVDD